MKLENYPSSTQAWDNQIRLFARYFLAHANLPQGRFSLLDAGCGTGAALAEIHKHYPRAHLYGIDLVEEHVQIANDNYEHYADFRRSDISEINQNYDVIYISNVLEHLLDWQKVVITLASKCTRLYILTPYKELLKNKAQAAADNVNHVASFDENSFDFLKIKDFSIACRIIRTPYSWGYPRRRELVLRLKAALTNQPFEVQREILVAMTNLKNSSSRFNNPFLSRPKAFLNYYLNK